MQPHRSRRPAFTLMELLVVITVITILAALTAVYFPRFQDQSRGADQLQGWLLAAKMQAKRDGLPTGIQITNTPGTTTSQVVYIQQPNSFAQGFYTGFTQPGGPGTQMFALIQLPTGVQFDSGPNQVFKDDYLEVYGGGVVHRISANATQAGNVASLPLDLGSAPLSTPPGTANATNYRIIPAPRPIPGEQTLTLPTNVAISFETPLSTNPAFTLSNVPPNGQILFAPSGAVIGQGTGTGQIIFWVRDMTDPMAVSPTPDWVIGKGTLITVQPRTGFIAAHPVSSQPNDPYAFTRDARSSGM